MKINKTKYVNSHHTNPDYTTLLVYFMNEDLTEYDDNFQLDRANRYNWMPTDDNMTALILEYLQVNPDYVLKLQKALEDKTPYRLTVPLKNFI